MSLNAVVDNKILVEEFFGFYDRGNNDPIPPDHLEVCSNAVFNVKQISKRPGSKPCLALTFNPVKFFLASINDELFWLILDDQGNIHKDAGPTILHVDGMLDFSAINLYNRVYIAPNEGTWSDKFLYVYTGAYNPRKAGGLAPTDTFTVADGPAETAPGAGLTAGVHRFAVCYQTDTGYITGPSVYQPFYTAPGGLTVTINNIPQGPTGVNGGVVGCTIIATKADELEYFFVPLNALDPTTAPNGYIPNGVTTVTLEFSDSTLIVSADYLNDIFDFVKCGTHVVFYHGRLILTGSDSLVRASNIQDPETFDSVTGYIAIPLEHDANPPVSAFIIRDTLYLSKFPGLFSTQDTDPSPTNWPLTEVDNTVGVFPNGISTFSAAFGGRNKEDMAILLTTSGILLFNGVFIDPELSWKIEDFWKLIVTGIYPNIQATNYNFWRFTPAIDVVEHKLYISCATADNANWVILHGDWQEGLNPTKIKWSIWCFPFTVLFIGMSRHPIDNRYLLRIIGTGNQNVWSLQPELTSDNGTRINFTLYFALQYQSVGYLTTFTMLQFRARGVASMQLICTDGERVFIPININFVDLIGRDYVRLINFMSEKIQVGITNLGLPGEGQIDINKLEIFCVPNYMVRPQWS